MHEGSPIKGREGKVIMERYRTYRWKGESDRSLNSMLVKSSSVLSSSRATTQGSISRSEEGHVRPESSSAPVKFCSPNTSLSAPTRGAAMNWTTAERMEDDKFIDATAAGAEAAWCDLNGIANLRVGGPVMAIFSVEVDCVLSIRLSVRPMVGLIAASTSLSSILAPLKRSKAVSSFGSSLGPVWRARYSEKDIVEECNAFALGEHSSAAGEKLLLCALCNQHIASALGVLSLHRAVKRS